MDLLKEAFSKIKEEINFLKKELDLLKNELNAIISYQNLNFNKIDPIEKKTIPTHYLLGEYNKSNKPAIDLNENLLLNGLKAQNFIFSTGNEGVPTDKPTDKPTDNVGINFNNSNENSGFLNISSNFEKAHIIISSLDDVKKDIRKTFKNLTSQEMLVFSTIYTYEDQKYENINYKLISDKLNLSESSIRDYVNKLIKKGIPITKRRLNNKKVILSISPTLKEITNLSTIIKLRDL